MKDVLSKAKAPIAIIIILIVGFIIYNTMFKKDAVQEELIRTSDQQTVGPSQEFVPLLNLIQSVNFDDKFFSDPVFRSMVDFSEPVQEEQKGRDNPFAPGIVSSAANVSAAGVDFAASETTASTSARTASSTSVRTASSTSATATTTTQ